MTNYIKHFTSLFTPQKDQARHDQVMNSAGGFGFALDKWSRLDRFLILGADGGTYYASERALTRDNAKVIAECLGEDGLRAVARIVALSESGRAPKQAPAIFALAMAAGDADPETRKAALAAVPRVCRTGTDLFHFARDVEGFRKWGRGLRSAIAGWYNDKPVERVAYQALKYRERDGWSHRDLLRLAHPRAPTPAHDALYRYIVGGEEALSRETPRGKPIDPAELPPFVRA
ncbi:MAG: TROVE domain-containing protein, partial [Polyangiaceae bacterium]